MTATLRKAGAKKRKFDRSDGLALIAVLWIVAALSILVIGMSNTVRREVRTTSSAREMVIGTAFGNAAIQLVLQRMVDPANRPNRLTDVSVSFRGVAMQVEVVPYSGFIDVNNAPEPLLAALYAVAGRLPAGAAAALAQATVAYRSALDRSGAATGFEVPEDLMRVPGMRYDLYASIARLVTAQRQGAGRVNPLAAPAGVLLVLAKGDASRAAAVASRRSSGEVGVDTSTFDPSFVDVGTSQRFLLVARVPLGDAAFLLSSRSVDFQGSALEELPWRTFQTEQRLEPAPASRH